MTTNNDLWSKVNSNAQLLEDVAQSDTKDVASMASLRKQWSVEEIVIAVSLLDARKRADGKLDNANSILADSTGVQQATSTRIAQHKAKRFLTQEPVFDLCCGIGSDLLALPEQTIGIDSDHLRCWMASQNSGKETRVEDVLQLDIPNNALIHIDPSRRSGTNRLHALDAMLPAIDEITTIATSCAGGCIKVSPAVDVDELEDFPLPFELEYIEEHGRVVQGVIWFGSLAHHVGQVTATSMTIEQTMSDEPCQPPFDSTIHGWILEPNPALERSGLHGNLARDLGASEPASGIGLCTAPTNPDSPWFQSFEVLGTTSLRLEKVSALLATLGCSQVEVKTRDKVVDPNQWQNILSHDPHGPLLTVFALRLGKMRISVITRRHKHL